ncbi:MAG TPA: DUF2089 domain-containing protein [Thermomicrobiales bacterium]|nr:DUF2089 domain-containing protein [Thermomicrobiales bacterium]
MTRYPPAPGTCPICGAATIVTRVDCPVCETRIEGRFGLGRFGRLTPEQLGFVEVFVKNRGIIKDVEAELGISYPTVRARLDDALQAMGYAVPDESRPNAPAAPDRRRVLEDLRDGRMSAEEAARLLALAR